MNASPNQSFVWDAVIDADDYQVELSQLNGTVDKLVTQVATSIVVGDLCEGVAGLTVGGTRRVRVRARNSFGDGNWTGYLTFTLVGLPAPTNLRIE